MVDTIPGSLDEPGDNDDEVHLNLEGGIMQKEEFNEIDEHLIPENLELLNEERGPTLKFVTKKNDDLIDGNGIRTIPDVDETYLEFGEFFEEEGGGGNIIKEKEEYEDGDLYE